MPSFREWVHCAACPGLLAVAVLAFVPAAFGQSILFNFENAPLMTPLPLDVSSGGITAHLSATGQGYSIQNAGVLGFTPAGFSGRCIYPSSVYPSDLNVSFSTRLAAFSILYASQELDCDCSAQMKVSAFLNGTLVGTATKSAVPGGTWPSATLSITVPGGFNGVVVHWNGIPNCGCDYGAIFMADNMTVVQAAAVPGDLDGDSRVNGADLALLLSAWGSANAAADLDHDGNVTGTDLARLLGAWTG